MIESATNRSRKCTETFQNYKSCGTQSFRKKRKRKKVKKQKVPRRVKRTKKLTQLAHQRIRDEKVYRTYLDDQDFDYEEYYAYIDYYCGMSDDEYWGCHSEKGYDFRCQTDGDGGSATMIPLNQLNLDLPKFQNNICKPKTFEYYSSFNEDESTLPEFPATILEIIWEFYPFLDFAGFQGVETPQSSPAASKWEMNRACDLETRDLEHEDAEHSVHSHGISIKVSCKKLKFLEGFYICKFSKSKRNRPIYEHVHHGHTLESDGSSWLMRTLGIRLGVLVKDPAKDPTEVKKRWTIYSRDSETICEKQPGWDEMDLPNLTTEMKTAVFEVEPMTYSQYRLGVLNSMLAEFEVFEYVLKGSNPEEVLNNTRYHVGVRNYKKFEIRISKDKSCFYLRFLHLCSDRCQYWFKVSLEAMFDLIYPTLDAKPMGELMGAMCPYWSVENYVSRLVEGSF